jgi:hypothetical protein
MWRHAVSDEVSPVVRARQMDCEHGFITSPGSPKRCAHCGISESEWDQIKGTWNYQSSFTGGVP